LIAFGGNNTEGAIDVATACRAKGGTGHGDFESETFVVADPICANEARTYSHEGRNNFRLRNCVLQPIAFDTTQITHLENRSRCEPGEPAPSLAKDGHVPSLASAAKVRHLTPRECERLQGFPDDYTLIPYRGKLAKDDPRYKALGNSMAVPDARWIGERIEAAETILQEAAA